ncbi:hypothetical protein GYMLUDRAFT_71933 [Collybiopsis luxurians FD-317 M1]|uniref:Uncharacterized protein n=1 Tax=Collybiopsis luxurians FD-317 M1 TaxID=944289 RepID=A0A0D0CVR6_9AGAR|nr:hypothetical protein GYMLUDRAFT_71933 [Collybiopsis luxurians FD-317 M1]
MSLALADSHSMYPALDDAQDTSTFELRDQDFADLPPMTFRPGKRADDYSDSGSDSDEEADCRNKPLPAPPSSSSPSTLSPRKPNSNALTGLSSPSISHISNFSTSTVSSYVTASSVSSVPVTPITPNSPSTPFLSASLSSKPSLSRTSSLSRTIQFTAGPGTRSRQPSIVSLAGGYHLPTMVAGKPSPTIGPKSSLPLLNDTDIEDDLCTDSDGYFSEETNTRRAAPVHLTRQPSLGSSGIGSRSGHEFSSLLTSEPALNGVMRRYASAGNLLSSSSRSSSPLGSGHQHSYSHPLPFPIVSPSPSPQPSSPSPCPGSSSTNTPGASASTRSRAESHSGESRVRSRAGSTSLRNAVYIEALDSNEVERRLLDLSSSGPDFDVVSEGVLEIDETPDKDLELSRWTPASSVVNLRSPLPQTSADSSLSMGWGFPKPPKIRAPPPTPSSPAQEFPASSSGSSVALEDAFALQSSSSETASKHKLFTEKPDSLSTSIPLIPSSPSRPDLHKSQDDSLTFQPTTSGKRQRLASFVAKMAGGTASQLPIHSTSGSASTSVPSSPTNLRASQHRPAPLDLSRKPKVFSALYSPADSGSITGASEPSTPAYSSSASSWDDESCSGTDTEAEDEMEEMDPDLIAVAAGLDLPSSPRTPRATPSPSQGSPVSSERGSDFPSTPTAVDDVQMGRGSYAQVYGFRSPKMPYIFSSGTYVNTSHSLAYLPSTQDEPSVPRGDTPTLSGSQSLISPGDLPPSGGSPKTPRVRKVTMINTSQISPKSELPISPSRSSRTPPSSPLRQSFKLPTSPGGKSPKSKSGRMSGLISRFTFGSSSSLVLGPPSASQDSVPPVPPLNLDELGQIGADPFAKDDMSATISVLSRTLSRGSTKSRSSSFISPGVLSSTEINGTVTVPRRERSGTTSTSTSAFSSSSIDSNSSSIERYSQKKRRSLGLSLGNVSIGTIGGIRSPKGTTRRKKRKLVISGVDVDDTRAYQAVKGWCEGFGEVRKFERQDNGNLVVDWRRRSVGDLVCRVQANVVIKGAGSVGLSWYQC